MIYIIRSKVDTYSRYLYFNYNMFIILVNSRYKDTGKLGRFIASSHYNNKHLLTEFD